MMIKFLATPTSATYTIAGETINGIDLSVLEQGDEFTGDETTNTAGIIDAYRQDGVLYATLKQAPPVTRVSYIVSGRPVSRSPDDDPPQDYTQAIEHRGGNWAESGWIDAATFDPSAQYIREVS